MRSERYQEIQAALALVATVVGAGFASGREVLRFFSIFGQWSWVGCVLAALLLTGLSAWSALLAARLNAYDLATLCRRALGERGGQAAAWLNGTLVTVTAGAMVAAMGELAALALPIHGAYQIGIVFSVAVAALAARRSLSTIAAIGGWLLPACLLLYALLLRDATGGNATPAPPQAWRALPMAFAYASMNAALGCGVLCELGRGKSRANVLRACAIAGALLLLLLLGANAALYRHVETLRDAALPIVMLARSLGAMGYWLCIAALSLAVITTLLALTHTLARMLGTAIPSPLSQALSITLPLLVGLTGFSTLVSSLYPLLGTASTLLFLAIVLKPIKPRSQVHNKSVVYSRERQLEGSPRNEPNNGKTGVST